MFNLIFRMRSGHASFWHLIVFLADVKHFSVCYAVMCWLVEIDLSAMDLWSLRTCEMLMMLCMNWMGRSFVGSESSLSMPVDRGETDTATGDAVSSSHQSTKQRFHGNVFFQVFISVNYHKMWWYLLCLNINTTKNYSTTLYFLKAIIIK